MTTVASSLGVKMPSQRPTSPGRSTRGGRTRAASSESSSTAYTLTACTRCRERKSRCDPALPKCTPCERSGANCEYWDTTKRARVPRNYIVQLQHTIRALEEELSKFSLDVEAEPDPEDMVREAAVVEFRETAEKKFLGPSSGTPMTRLVVRFAKQVVGASSIREVITSEQFRDAEDRNIREQKKATSKIDPESYPLVSSYAARELPGKELVFTLLNLYNVRVQTMYPLFHEQTLQQIFEEVYAGTRDPFKNFVARIVIAIGLQRLDAKYAGAGDSYYLGALDFFEQVVRRMNIDTLQCFVLIGQYGLLTPTRTATFYIVGMGVRIAEALGLNDEATIAMNADGSSASAYEIDIKRRVFWAIVTMDYGLSHSLGRPAMLATGLDHLNVQWFAAVDDSLISQHEIKSGPVSVRKWIAIHFYKMRLLQLEIRRKLYLRRQPTPTDESDPWFTEMEEKLEAWRKAGPDDDQNSGFGGVWFTGRYNTIIVMMFRPTPQIPTPSSKSAVRCFEACKFNIHMTRDQIRERKIEVTWIFTQTIFSCVNTILWALSYGEVRQICSRDDVKDHLNVALEAMQIASERWPGVTSAIYIYQGLIGACLRSYEHEGDIKIHGHPFATVDGHSNSGESNNVSRTQSPSLASQSPAISHLNLDAAFSSPRDLFRRNYAASNSTVPSLGYMSEQSSPQINFHNVHLNNSQATGQYLMTPPQTGVPATMPSQYNAMPTTFSEMENWHFQPSLSDIMPSAPMYTSNGDHWLDPEDDQTYAQIQEHTEGLTKAQQMQLMTGLEGSSELAQIEQMIAAANSQYLQA